MAFMSASRAAYVHGYRPRESRRLRDQANALTGLLHSPDGYPPGATVLEAGCGVGAQTVTLAARSPAARIVSVDMNARSLATASARVSQGADGVRFAQADIFALPFRPASFDHVFACFVLEHVPRPEAALEIFRGLLRPGGSITVIEGDHGSAYFHPDSAAARAAIGALVTLQQAGGGDPLIGRRLRPLLDQAGFDQVSVSPRLVYADASRPDLAEEFTRNTFTAMIEGTRDAAIAAGLTDPASFDAGIRDLYRTAEPDGVFCYTFFRATATVQSPRGAAS